MATYLDRIVAHHRARAALDTRSEAALRVLVEGLASTRPFAKELAGCADGGTVGVIAEIKRRSPSAGNIGADLDVAALADAYARGGATALSVLTDEPHFGGSVEDLRAARAASGRPVLRKDFTVCRADCFEARAMGADAVLLIAAALSDEELAELYELATELGLDALCEVHDEDELKRVLGLGASLVGVNQRDLHSFAVDTNRALSLMAKMPSDAVAVAESGLRSVKDVERLADAGYSAVLVGETFVTADDPAAVVAAFAAVRTHVGQESPACS